MEATRIRLAEGVHLTYLPARKFKTSLLSAQFVTPLRRETAGANALLAAVLRRGTVSCPDMGALSAKMDNLYDASIDYTVRKKGENQCVGFVASFIDDRYAPGGERLLEPAAALLGELVCDPVTYHGRFVPEYFESEKTNLLEAIRSLINDKRDWADSRLLRALCDGEAYAVPRLGDEETAERIDARSLYLHSRTLLASSRVEVLYCGSAERQRVEDAVLAALRHLPRGQVAPLPPIRRFDPRPQPRVLSEEMDVNQGKLGLGYRCATEDTPAMILANLIFGGTSNSKLFMNVRERLSLCYYASSSYARSKGIMTVSSGVEQKDYDRAVEEITRQLTAVQNGDWEDWEQQGALQAMLSSLTSLPDSQSALENYYLGQIATDCDETPEQLARALREVTKERIMAAAQSARLDTVYFLHGKEEA